MAKSSNSTSPAAALGPKEKLELYYFLRLTRECDNAILRLYRQGKMIGGAYTGTGNEATAVGSAYALETRDYLLPMHRDLGAHLVKGQSVRNIFLQQLGRVGSLTSGRDGTGHYADPQLRIYGNISHLAAMIPVASGIAMAAKMRKENIAVLTYIGDGGSNVGEFHEGLNMAAVMRLPLVLIIENNQFAYSTPLSKQIAAAKLSDRAVGYGIPGTTIDGTDVVKVYDTCRVALERARRGEGPTLIESMTMRMQGHSASDDASYVPKSLVEDWKAKDPIALFEVELMTQKILNEAGKRDIEMKVQREIDEAVHFAESAPYPEGPTSVDGVYAP